MDQEGAQLSGMLTSLPGRYAKALYNIADEKKLIEKIDQELMRISTLINASDEFKKALHTPSFARKDLKNALSKIAKSLDLSNEVTAFLEMLATHRRLQIFAQIQTIYHQIVRTLKNLQEAAVTSAYPLTERQKQDLYEVLTKFSGTNVEINFKEDTSLLGGIVVRMGNKVIDASLSTRLNNFSQKMKGTR